MYNKKILITSALPYIHGILHIGNLVGSLLPADVYYKYMKLLNRDVIFICGSDSHGTMFEVSAKKAGIPTADYVYDMHEKNKKILECFGLEFTYYGITNSENNKKITYEIFKKLDKNGYIFEKNSEMFYCEDCKLYLADRWVEGKCAHCGGLARGDQCDDCTKILDTNEILNPICIHCGRKNITRKKLKNLYLDLPKIWAHKKLDVWLNSNKMDSFPLAVTKGYLNKGLKARAISRSGTNWGFHIPKQGFEEQVFYVWFDAPIGYVGITKDWCDISGEKLENWWKTNKVKLVQFLGKDNIFFHSIFFPCILKGADENYNLVNKLKGYAFLLGGKTKFSKSRGVGLNNEVALETFPADYWRFYLIYKLPEKTDTLFSWEDFQRIINKELIDNFGNLVHRVKTLIKTKNIIDLPQVNIEKSPLYEKIKNNLDNELLLSEVLKDILNECAEANKFMQDKAPWKSGDSNDKFTQSKKEGSLREAKNKEVLKELYIKIQIISKLISPIIPNAIKRLESGENKPLFEKITDEKIKEQIKKFDLDDDKPKEQIKKFDLDDDKPKEQINNFSKLDLKIGEIIFAEPILDSDKLLVLQVDFGSEKRQIVSGIRAHYSPSQLIGKKAVFLTNLKPRTLKGFESQGMILIAEKRDGLAQKWSILIVETSEKGSAVFVEPTELKLHSEIEFSDFQAVNLVVNKKGEVIYNNKPLTTKNEKIKTDRKVESGAQIY